jgi:hypothetical protein
VKILFSDAYDVLSFPFAKLQKLSELSKYFGKYFSCFYEIILEQEKGATVSRLQEHRGAPFVCFHL